MRSANGTSARGISEVANTNDNIVFTIAPLENEIEQCFFIVLEISSECIAT